MAKVKVRNNANQYITIVDNSLRFRMAFERKGVIRMIDFDTLQQLIYKPGVERMFKDGILVIDDLETKIALGLEPEGVKESVNIIVLNDNQKKRYLSVAPMNEFKEITEKLSREQLKDLAHFAIANEIVGNIEKLDILKEKTGIDVLKGIQFNKEEKKISK